MHAPAPKILLPLSIELGDATSQPYKSIDRIAWRDIPPFAVLTGVNGSGKTQFLQALAYRISKVGHPQFPLLDALPLTVSGDEIAPHEVAYLPNGVNHFNAGGASIANLTNAKQQFVQSLSQGSNDIDGTILRERVKRKYGIQAGQDLQDQLARLPDDFVYMLQYADVSAGLSNVFIGYQIRRAQKLMDQQPEEKILEELGQPPWDFVNEALASAEFAYRVVPPGNELLQTYQLKIVALGGSTPLDLNDLSSGEMAILRTLLWFYNSKHNKIFPKLFLMDEPDAHLHPSMTRQFIDVIKNVLVDQYNVRVILTTHSASTVALAPDEFDICNVPRTTSDTPALFKGGSNWVANLRPRDCLTRNEVRPR